MILNLTRADLLNLIRGCRPSYEAMAHPLVKPFFRYYDHPQHEEWVDLDRLTDVQLWTMYLICEPRSIDEAREQNGKDSQCA